MTSEIVLAIQVETLRQAREARGLTLAHIAQKLAVNQGDLSRLETGQLGASPVRLRRLIEGMADVLGISADEAWRLAPYQKPEEEL